MSVDICCSSLMGVGSLLAIFAPAAAALAGYLAGALVRSDNFSREAIAAARDALHTCWASVDALRVSSGVDICRQALEVCGDTTQLLTTITASSADLASKLDQADQENKRLTVKVKLQLGLIGFLIFVIGILVIYIFKGIKRGTFTGYYLIQATTRWTSRIRCPTCSLCHRRALAVRSICLHYVGDLFDPLIGDFFTMAAITLNISGPQILVHYSDGADGFVWHHRALLKRTDKARWVCFTPDHDLCVHNLGTIHHIVLERKSSFPAEQRDEVYAHDDISTTEMAGFRRRAAIMALARGEGDVEVHEELRYVAEPAHPSFGVVVPSDLVHAGSTMTLKGVALVSLSTGRKPSSRRCPRRTSTSGRTTARPRWVTHDLWEIIGRLLESENSFFGMVSR